jgi:two-component system response regulator PilR (NtrC family)
MNAPVNLTGAARVLVVDDEPDLRTLYELTLLREGHQVDSGRLAGRGARAAGRPAPTTSSSPTCACPTAWGWSCCATWRRRNARERSIVITAYGSAENAVEALKCGAFDYLTKPVDLKQFRGVVARRCRRRPARAPPAPASGAARRGRAPARATRRPRRPRGRRTPRWRAWSANRPPCARSSSASSKVARSMAPVLVQGESGTGKELVAAPLHEVQPPRPRPLRRGELRRHPGAPAGSRVLRLPQGLLHRGGARPRGLLPGGAGGTLFLDEIGDLPLAMQAKLLRAIQERRVRPLGETQRAGGRAHRQRHPQGPGGRGAGRPLPAGPVLPPERDRDRVPPLRERSEDLPALCDPAARIAPTPACRCRTCRGGARGCGLSPPSLGQRARAGEPAAPGRGPAVGRELIQAATWRLGGDRRQRQRLACFAAGNCTGPPPAPARRPGAAPLPSDLVAKLARMRVERDMLVARWNETGFNRTAAAAQPGPEPAPDALPHGPPGHHRPSTGRNDAAARGPALLARGLVRRRARCPRPTHGPRPGWCGGRV